MAFNPCPDKFILPKKHELVSGNMIRSPVFELEDFYSLAYMSSFILYRLAEAPGNGEGLPSFSFKILIHARKPKQPTFS